MTKRTETENIIRLALIRIGINIEHAGFDQLQYFVEEAIEDPQNLQNITLLAEKIATKHKIDKPFRLEANIFNAISRAHKKTGLKYLNDIFGFEVVSPIEKPTSTQIIKLLAEYVNLKLYKKEYIFKES